VRGREEGSESLGDRERERERRREIAIKRPRTRSAAVRHWHDLSLSAYERDLGTNEKV